METPNPQAQHVSDEDALYRKVAWRMIPLLLMCYVVAYLDRVNVGFAKLQMLDQLGFSETVYGLGAGVFFIGYFIFEIPSNIILHRIGARVWIGRIMVSWGLISAAMMFVTTPTSFYVMRFLLGVAEAGFFPGIILFCNIGAFSVNNSNPVWVEIPGWYSRSFSPNGDSQEEALDLGYCISRDAAVTKIGRAHV